MIIITLQLWCRDNGATGSLRHIPLYITMLLRCYSCFSCSSFAASVSGLEALASLAVLQRACVSVLSDQVRRPPPASLVTLPRLPPRTPGPASLPAGGRPMQ